MTGEDDEIRREEVIATLKTLLDDREFRRAADWALEATSALAAARSSALLLRDGKDRYVVASTRSLEWADQSLIEGALDGAIGAWLQDASELSAPLFSSKGKWRGLKLMRGSSIAGAFLFRGAENIDAARQMALPIAELFDPHLSDEQLSAVEPPAYTQTAQGRPSAEPENRWLPPTEIPLKRIPTPPRKKKQSSKESNGLLLYPRGKAVRWWPIGLAVAKHLAMLRSRLHVFVRANDEKAPESPIAIADACARTSDLVREALGGYLPEAAALIYWSDTSQQVSYVKMPEDLPVDPLDRLPRTDVFRVLQGHELPGASLGITGQELLDALNRAVQERSGSDALRPVAMFELV